MEFGIIWILFFAALLFLGFFFSSKLRADQKYRNEQKAIYEEKRQQYTRFDSNVFDQTPDEELTHAVLFHIMAKEDKLYEGETVDQDLVDVLTHGEKLVYTIYQIENSLEGGRGSIHTFFISEPYCTYRPFYKDAFDSMNCHDLTEIMEAAERLAIAIENDEEDEIEDDSDYAYYNFSDFTGEIISLLKSSGLVEKCSKYIRDHKEEFIEEGESNEERISD